MRLCHEFGDNLKKRDEWNFFIISKMEDVLCNDECKIRNCVTT